MKLTIVPLVLFAALMVGCAGDFGSSDPGSSTTVDTSAVDSFNDTQQRINAQMAADAANAAAAQQNAADTAAAQQTENNANAEFNQNGPH